MKSLLKSAMIAEVFLGVFLISPFSWSFPEMVKKDYPNCTACHHSPSGGGVLTAYGRELSRELLSRWNSGESESQFAYLYTPPESISLGGDLRFLQTYKDTQFRRTAQYFIMQADLEAAVTLGQFSGVGTLGIRKGGGALGRRHYLVYRPMDPVSIRLGRFMPTFGINTADHVIVTKRGLGFDQETETYNFETAWVGENLNAYLTAVGGRPDDSSLDREKGAALQLSLLISEKHKLGLSYFYGSKTSSNRHLGGPFGIFGLSPSLVFLAEWDFQSKNTGLTSGTPSGFVNYHKLDYELTQGLHAFLSQEFSQLSSNDASTRSEIYSIGAQFFPRPHFELLAQWQKQKIVAVSDNFIDIAWLLIHFYP